MSNRLLQGMVAGGVGLVGMGFLYQKMSKKPRKTYQNLAAPCGCSSPVTSMMTAQICTEIVPNFVAKTPKPSSVDQNTPRIFHIGGKQTVIRTMAGGDASGTAEAMGIYGRQIVAVGTFSAVEKEMSERFPTLEIKKQQLRDFECIVPGLIEPHVHILTSAVMKSWNDYSPWNESGLAMKPTYNLQWLGAKLTSDLKDVKAGYWLVGMGVDPSLLISEPFPDMLGLITNESLDGISKDVPIHLLAASGHTSYLNTVALQQTWEHAKNSGNTKFLEKYPTAAVYVEKTNGILNELEEQLPTLGPMPQSQLDEIVEQVPDNLIQFMADARERGVTMMYDAGTTPDHQDMLKAMSDQYPIHVGMANVCGNIEQFQDFASQHSWSAPTIDTLQAYIGSIKLISDGSNQGITGYQSEHYQNAETYGLWNFGDVGTGKPSDTPPQEFTDLVCAVAAKGWPNMIHANGDQANRYTLQAYEEARQQVGVDAFKELRNRIEHCSLLWAPDVTKIKELDVSPSFLIGHVGFWGYVFRHYIFGDKAKRLDLTQSMVNLGVPFTCHSDSAVTPLGPLRMMEQAVTRKLEWSPEAQAGNDAASIPELVPGERISAAEALKMLTYNAAWQCHADALVGSLEPNKLADFVVLEQDPVLLSADKAYMTMRFIKIKESWIQGDVKTY